MIQSVADPQPERGSGEEGVLLTEHIELGIPVQNTSRDELVEDADDEGRKNGENDVVHGQGP